MRRAPTFSLVVAGIFCAGALRGENRLSIRDQDVAAAGSGRRLTVFALSEVKVLGFSLGINYDQTAILVRDVVADDTPAEAADFFAGTIDIERGLLGYGCVFSFGGREDRILHPGMTQPVAHLLIDVLAAAGSRTEVRLESVLLEPNPGQPYVVRNVFTDEIGMSLYPILDSGFMNVVVDSRPAIIALGDNSGREGKVFQVTADFIEEPGLAVRVCGSPAAFTIEPGGRMLLVTAPACGSLGYAPVEVCTAAGCDVEEAGFRYLPPVPEFLRGDANADSRVDISDGVGILEVLFHGEENPPCRDALDANDNGFVDVADAVFVLNFLFLLGRRIPPPYPQPGVDPTGDRLPDC